MLAPEDLQVVAEIKLVLPVSMVVAEIGFNGGRRGAFPPYGYGSWRQISVLAARREEKSWGEGNGAWDAPYGLPKLELGINCTDDATPTPALPPQGGGG